MENIYREYGKEYILILLTPQGSAAEGRAPCFVDCIRVNSFPYSLYILH